MSSSQTRQLRGKPLADQVRADIAARTAAMSSRGLVPTMAVVIASDDGAVHAYAQSKVRTAEKLGITLRLETVDPADGQGALEAMIEGLSADRAVHGILLELPLADGLDETEAIARIAPEKDVDGLTAVNLGLIAAGREGAALAPATPRACLMLAEQAANLAGANVTVVGRGRTVGRALAAMLINRDATVTVCHTKTRDLAAAMAGADVVFVAAGRAGLIGPDTLAAHHVVIDAGINPTDDGLVGDVDPTADGLVKALTPVPGGVGPLTTALIFDNLLRAMALQGLEQG